MAVAVVVAGGAGTRLGHVLPKALVPLAGRPLVAWSLEVLCAVALLRRIVVVLPAGEELPDDPTAWGLAPGAWDGPDGRRVVAVPGGAERSHSVRAGLRAAGDGPPQEPVLVHDGARPMVTVDLVRACLLGVAAGADAAIAAAAVTDTVKSARAPHGAPPEPGDPVGLPRVDRTIDRSLLWSIQTPQVFRRGILAAAMDRPDVELAAATDDASLVEAAGGDVRLVPAPRTNLKVTVPEDLHLAGLLLREVGQNPAPC
ncbi:IspD/TarI family cytidylyltransferase [Patulibacter minatonensis]|uniref:IspD/TarI family cytidylyltransferase n=1 Tax=Patulibacter minatonensis TaxID=298163 RepID=UPI00047A01AD|nr:2-C-methyl-D-erythritol 4-phosphate cytidylyltransferase [Patulibacter minatonensis]